MVGGTSSTNGVKVCSLNLACRDIVSAAPSERSLAERIFLRPRLRCIEVWKVFFSVKGLFGDPFGSRFQHDRVG